MAMKHGLQKRDVAMNARVPTATPRGMIGTRRHTAKECAKCDELTVI